MLRPLSKTLTEPKGRVVSPNPLQPSLDAPLGQS